MKICYADPPYVNQARKHYRKEAICEEVNHNVLFGYLCSEFDTWALSCSTSSLKYLLTLPECPDDVRVASWVKPFAIFRPGVNPAYTWEPVLYWHPKKRDRDVPTVRDWVSSNITLQKGLSGAKPKKFCFWLFELLGVDADDEFTDLFPGTGIVNKTLSEYLSMKRYNEESFLLQQ